MTGVLEAFRQEAFTTSAGAEFHVTFSAGVAQYPDDGFELQSLYRAADKALYEAKRGGRNRVHLAEDRPQQLLDRQYA
jgi:diguanylate cyclase (GGDEF)-like protein